MAVDCVPTSNHDRHAWAALKLQFHRMTMGVDTVEWFLRHFHQLSMERKTLTPELIPGTVDLLLLRVLVTGPMHGYGIAQRIKQISESILQVGESSLYPALQRLLVNGWVKAEWGTSENNRRARYYSLTGAGRKQLAAERKEFEKMSGAIHRVLEMA